ncbi:hypothetical protein BMR99_09865 [Propionibacterium freudenreichii]|nr:hypothetical protein BMR99_09865 [Propionibacterium freudenreichii]
MDLRMKAARVAGQADLRDIRTAALHAEVDFPPQPGSNLGYDLDSNFEFALPQDEGDLTVVMGQYTASLSVKEGDEKKEFARLGFTLMALYEVGTPQGDAFSHEELEAFVRTSGQFALYPYARETMSMLTTRLGVPNLTLPVLRVALDKDEVQRALD